MIRPREAKIVAVGSRGPAHRHGVTRRQVMAAGAAGVGAVFGSQVLGTGVARAARTPGAPRPIPGGFELGGTLFHVFFPGTGEPNTITDFNGFVGVGQVDGHGTGADSGSFFDVDNRFFVGEYVATSGKRYHAAFGFV
jgi:hypothetical protein